MRPVFTAPSPRFRSPRFACLGGCGLVVIFHPHMPSWCPGCFEKVRHDLPRKWAIEAAARASGR
jgi:hypothetical protein